MHSIQLWWWFWTGSFIVSGTGFFVVAFLVLLHGIGEIKEMIAKVTSQHDLHS